MATTTVTEVMENLYKLPLLAVKTAKSTPGSKEEVPKEKDVFLLKCRSYYDLRAYLFAGMTLPSTSEEFKKLYPPENCTKLTAVDAGIYKRTESTFLNIHKSCERFDRENMGYITQIAGDVQTFCRTSIFLMEGNKLKGQLKILLDDKYEEEGNRDKAFEDSRKACRSLLEGMKNAASKTAADIKKVIAKLEGFQDETMLNQSAVNFLKKQYKQGPVVDTLTGSPKLDADGKPFKPYAKYINEELENLREQLTKDISRRDEEYENWKHYTIVAATSVTYIFCPIASGIVMGIYTDKAIKADAAYEEYKAKVEKDEADIVTLNALNTNITGLCIQFEDIGMKIEAAMSALVEIKSLFDKQSENFGQAVNMFGLASNNVNEDLYLRKLMLQDCIDKAVESFKTVITLADEFKKAQFQAQAPPTH